MTASHPLSEQFRLQAGFCSPLYATLLGEIAADLDRGGVSTRVLAGHENDRRGTVLPLRLLGAVHRLVLTGDLPDLAAYYPSVGGSGPPDEAWPALRTAFGTHRDQIRTHLDRPVQTNEVGRSAQLYGGLLVIAHATGLPVRLLELGASAGLNLLVDRFRYDVALNGGPPRTIGDPASPLRFDRPWEGAPPVDVSAPLAIEERAGCDPLPIDPADPEGQLSLTSFVWPDDLVRLERLRSALAVAATDPPEVQAAGGDRWLAERLGTPQPGVVTVVWHSVVWQYVDRAERQGILDALSGAAERATATAPVAYLRYEPRRTPPRYSGLFELRVSIWPAGPVDRVIATGAGHGIPARWSQ
jgi:hypothetical protein